MKQFNMNVLFVIFFVILSNLVFAQSTGTDEKAVELIGKINNDYKPWFKPIWSPPKEIENLIFTLQAAGGAGLIGYFIGFQIGRKSLKK